MKVCDDKNVFYLEYYFMSYVMLVLTAYLKTIISYVVLIHTRELLFLGNIQYVAALLLLAGIERRIREPINIEHPFAHLI